MVYESDFYTTRRYRPSPSLSTYTVSFQPSRQVRILPGLGKVHVVHTYDRIVPYVGHKRLTVVSPPPQTFKVRPSVLLKEFDRIQYKYRPAVSYSYVNNYLNSSPSVKIVYVRKPIPGLDTHTIYRPGRLYLHSVVSRPTRLYFNMLGHKRHWFDVRISYQTNPYLGYNRLYSTLTNVYYHSLIDRPSKLYYDILGRLRWSPSWYRYWYDIPSKYYPYHYNVDSSYLPIRWYSSDLLPSLWHKYKYPLSYANELITYPSLKSLDPTSWYNYVSPNLYTYKYLNYNPAWSRFWRSAWSRWYDLTFNDETSRIKADAASLLKRIHTPVIRTPLSLLPYNIRYSEPIYSARVTADDYNRIYKLFSSSPFNSKISHTTYYSEPVKRYIGPGHLAAIRYSGNKAYGRRSNIRTYDDPVKDDIQLLSYYINKFRSDKALTGKEASSAAKPLSPARPSRVFTPAKPIPEPEHQEKIDFSVDRVSLRLGRVDTTEVNVESKLKRKKEEAKLAEERAIAEEAAKKKSQALKEDAARKAELARQEELAAQAAAERAAELERKAELAKQEEIAKQAEIERIRKEEEERARLEEEKRLAEEAKAEEERQQLLRLEEIARQAEEERENELARQAEELAELARQEAELEELARKEAEAAAQAKREEELAELARQEAELEELEKQEKELAELARQEAELAELAKQEADIAKQEAEIANLVTQEAELSELKEKQQAELNALAAEAEALAGDEETEAGGEGGEAVAATKEEDVEEEAEEEEEEEE